jgi:hypothetical protein
MPLGNLGPAETLTIGIVFGAMVLGLVGGFGYKILVGAHGHRWKSRAKKRSDELLHEFAYKISLIEHKQRVLSVYTNEYFTTFHEAGWEDLQSLVENLRTIETSLRVMGEQGDYERVCDICEYLMGRCSAESARTVAETYEGLAVVENWREESRVILLRLIQATTESAEKTAELGAGPKRMSRRPTLLSLAELRDSMGDF